MLDHCKLRIFCINQYTSLVLAMEEIDFHPIELAAHSLLSASLDSVHENFNLLHQSQHILLTRLKHIEHRLLLLEASPDLLSEQDMVDFQERIHRAQKQLADQNKILVDVSKRLGRA